MSQHCNLVNDFILNNPPTTLLFLSLSFRWFLLHELNINWNIEFIIVWKHTNSAISLLLSCLSWWEYSWCSPWVLFSVPVPSCESKRPAAGCQMQMLWHAIVPSNDEYMKEKRKRSKLNECIICRKFTWEIRKGKHWLS